MTKIEYLKELLTSGTEGLAIFDFYKESVDYGLIEFKYLKKIFYYFLEKGIFIVYYKGEKIKKEEVLSFLDNEENWKRVNLDYQASLSIKGIEYYNNKKYEKEILKNKFIEFELIK